MSEENDRGQHLPGTEKSPSFFFFSGKSTQDPKGSVSSTDVRGLEPR